VPLGPQKQLDMYFHAVEQIKLGKEQARIENLQAFNCQVTVALLC
jgi:hypothetical protein